MAMLKIGVSLLTVASLTFGAAARADDEKVPLDKLPAKVKEAVKAKFPDAELVSAEKETDNGKVLYEVNLKVKKQVIDVTVTEDGKIVEVETAIEAKDLPKTVTDALDKKYGKAKYHKVEDIVKGDQKYFEVLLEYADGKKKVEVQIDKDGKILEEEDKSNQKDEKK